MDSSFNMTALHSNKSFSICLVRSQDSCLWLPKVLSAKVGVPLHSKLLHQIFHCLVVGRLLWLIVLSAIINKYLVSMMFKQSYDTLRRHNRLFCWSIDVHQTQKSFRRSTTERKLWCQSWVEIRFFSWWEDGPKNWAIINPLKRLLQTILFRILFNFEWRVGGIIGKAFNFEAVLYFDANSIIFSLCNAAVLNT